MNNEDQYVDFKPVIRMQLEGARAQIIHHLSGGSVEWQAALGAAIDEAVDEFPWKDTIKGYASDVIQESILEYFRNGPGKEMITRAVSEAITDSGFVVDPDSIRELLKHGLSFDEY